MEEVGIIGLCVSRHKDDNIKNMFNKLIGGRGNKEFSLERASRLGRTDQVKGGIS